MVTYFNFKSLLNVLLALIATSMLWVLMQFIHVNHIRGDEFLSFLHSNPEKFDLMDVMGNIHQGADHSYSHAALLWASFSMFGYTIIVQRLVSFVFWIITGILLYQLMKQWKWPLEYICLTMVLILFSNLGIFLATDGRFYSMVSCLAIAYWLWLSKSINQSITYLLMHLAFSLIMLLTSPLLFIWQVVAMCVCVIRLCTKMISIKLFMSHVAVVLLSWVVYMIFFKVTFMVDFFSNPLKMEYWGWTGKFDTDVFQIPFRSMMLPGIPFAGDIANGLLAGVVFCFAIWSLPKSEFLYCKHELYEYSVVVACLMILLVFVPVFIPVPIWPIRYYAICFFLFGLVFIQVLKQLTNHKKWQVIIIGYLLLLVVRVAMENNKIALRQKQLMQLPMHQKLFVENGDGDYTEFVKMGELYVRFPELRNTLQFRFYNTDKQRAAYFIRLKEMGYAVNWGLVENK